jgi:hypothetical protein
MTRTRWAILGIAATLPLVVSSVIVASSMSMASCAATPTIPPLRSFESARDIDVVCLQVYTTSQSGQVPGLALFPPIPVEQQLCAPVPVNYTGQFLPYHLFGLVTQMARGEVAVVDLTAGMIIDEDPATPGNQFLAVGANPVGIAAAPNGAMTFVTSADPTKPAIYGLPSVGILGAAVSYDSGVATVYGGADAQAPTILNWPACSLPAVPGPIVAIPQSPQPLGAAEDGGPESQGYVLAVVLPGDGQTQVARVVTIDPRPMLRGGGVEIGPGPTVAPGSLDHCPIIGETPLSGRYPAQTTPGPSWFDGVPYVIDGGPAVGSARASQLGYVGPTPLPLPGFTCMDGGIGSPTATIPPDAGPALPRLLPAPPQATAAARAGTYLYVGDQSIPIIHVIDLSNPLAPKEIQPLLATSALEPTRQVIVSKLAVSPVTREYKRYLYALDQQDTPASIIVYDITDPTNAAISPRVPLQRPHAELTPQFPIDRIQFTAPVAAMAFAEHDFPLDTNPATGVNNIGAVPTGLLCNPNPALDLDAGSFTQSDGQVVPTFSGNAQGAFYRNNFTVNQVSLGPGRLRGIFGFATLTNGEVTLIDIDDWDSPCRRPITMTQFTSDIAPPQQQKTPPGGSPLSNLYPYQVPEAGATNGLAWVTNEYFFPVSQPHRPRSYYPLDNDPLLGPHFPELVQPPQLFNLLTGTGLTAGAEAGAGIPGNPVILPPDSGQLANPSGVGLDGGTTGVQIAWEDPLAHQNQSWTITYEGALPTFNTGTLAYMTTSTHYESLEISFPGGQVCEKGVEDWDVGQQRVAAATSDTPAGVLFPSDMPRWVGDYVQVANDLVQENDAYWTSPQTCWSDTPGPGEVARLTAAQANDHYTACYNYFEPYINQSVTRDFPIIEAYDNHLVITRFNYPPNETPDGGDASAFPVPEATSNRWVTPAEPSNVVFLRNLQCCFNKQATFNVRAGGEWVASGQVSVLLHHVITDPTTNRCVLSCDPQQALLNSRSLGFYAPNGVAALNGGNGIDRNSPLAMRNPMFSYYILHPLGPWPTLAPNDARYSLTCSPYLPGVCDVARVQRDLSFEFTTENAFVNQTVNLASTGTQVNPQSMLFIPSLGQVAVVDGAQEGLVLIDLNAVAVSGTAYQ